MEFGELIKIYREKNFLSQTDLTRKTGLNQKSISDIESGKVKTPQGKTIKILQEALNITTAEVASSLTNTKQQSKLEKLNNYKPSQISTKTELIIPEVTKNIREVQILNTNEDVIGSYPVADVTADKFDFFLKSDRDYRDFFIEKGMMLGIKRENHCEKGGLIVKKSQSGLVVKNFEEADKDNFTGKVIMKVTDLREV